MKIGAIVTEIAEILAEVSFFALLDEKERAFLAEKVTLVHFRAGDVLFNYGDPAHSMYVLKSGHVELTVRTKTGENVLLGRRSAHEFFGEISLLDGGPRTASARALDDVEALEIDQADIAALFRLQPSAALHMLSATGDRLRHTTQILRNVSARNPNADIEVRRTLVVRVTDWIAGFAGSLTFLAIHVSMFAFWLGWNSFTPTTHRFDAFPFGLLTLVVSLEQVILMVFLLLSQNREAERDRVRNDIEYDVNLKAEMQIAHMHEKVDENYSATQHRLDQIERKLDNLTLLLAR